MDQPPAIVIVDDRGGAAADYIRRTVEALRSGAEVRIDGPCLSACTLFLHLPPRQVCVTPRAVLGFHEARSLPARQFVADDAGAAYAVAPRDERATRWVFAWYPPAIRRWLSDRGGLTGRPLFLEGADLRRLFRSCRPSAAH